MQDTTARVLSCEPLAQELVRLILSAPEIAAQAKAGQFIHMLVPDSGHVLRRPISLMAVDAAAGTLTLAIQPKGAGTQMLCACKPGETIRPPRSITFISGSAWMWSAIFSIFPPLRRMSFSAIRRPSLLSSSLPPVRRIRSIR